MSNSIEIESMGAIVCSHVASEGLPILGALRAEPQDAADSGWQFMCYSGREELIASAQIWTIRQVLQHDPSLRPFIELSTGTRIVRSDSSSDWSVQ